ncbi:MAG: hypothetical protein U0587_16405 [Candidatus Binatia bacterium]
MNGLPLHPAIVHLPLGLAAVMPLVAGGVAVAVWKDLLPRRVWLVVVLLQALLYAGGVVALRTGEAEEDRAEKLISKQSIEEHEELAEQFVWGAGVTLALSVAGLVLRRGRRPVAFMAATAVATIVTGGLGLRVGHAGGQLVHGPRGLISVTQAAGGGSVERGMGGTRPSDGDRHHGHDD